MCDFSRRQWLRNLIMNHQIFIYLTFIDVSEPSDESLIMISSFSIKDEVGRETKINGIETKFYALERINIIACSFIFRTRMKGRKPSVFAFFVTLPYKELSQFMPRYSLCESNVCRLLSKHLISRMESDTSKVSTYL